VCEERQEVVLKNEKGFFSAKLFAAEPSNSMEESPF
jgi:hypothetical protein